MWRTRGVACRYSELVKHHRPVSGFKYLVRLRIRPTQSHPGPTLLDSHRSGHRSADPLCRGLDIPVREMGVTQGHSHVAVPEQSRDDRHRDAVHDGVTGHRVSVIPKPE